MSRRTDHQCSFCGKLQSQGGRLLAGVDGVYICHECVILCEQAMARDIREQAPKSRPGPQPSSFSPKVIRKKLDEYVVGQERAKKVLSVAVYNHYKRVWSNRQHAEVELQKSNILMLGPSGSGKTLLAQTLAKILDVPFTIVDATSLTEAGYVGEDVENILLRLIQASDLDIGRAEHGIIYIDEIDKMARKMANPSITRDVSGEGVQQALLKIVEGCVANVPPQGGRKHPHQEFLQINTERILFMCGGAFEGISDIIEKRAFRDRRSLGFRSGAVSTNGHGPADDEDILRHVEADDLLEYGFIPEFVGRFPVVVSLAGLDPETLVRVLTEPKDALVKQYQALFKMDGVELVFTDDGLQAAAAQAIGHKTGARRLRAILEDTLLDVMYELPSIPDVAKCIVDADAIQDDAGVSLELAGGETLKLDAAIAVAAAEASAEASPAAAADIDDDQGFHPAAS